MLVAILSIYFVAVTLAGFSPNIGDALGMSRPNELYLLIGIRAVQGVGMAMFPLAFALIGEEFPKQRVAYAQGIVSAMFSAGASLGLFGGAWITQNFGWQLTYHTVIPIAVDRPHPRRSSTCRSRGSDSRQVDRHPGVAAPRPRARLFLLGLTEGPTWGWGNWSGATARRRARSASRSSSCSPPSSLVVFIALGALAAARPIVDFAKLAERNILLSNLIGLFAGVSRCSCMFVGIVARAEATAAGRPRARPRSTSASTAFRPPS